MLKDLTLVGPPSSSPSFLTEITFKLLSSRVFRGEQRKQSDNPKPKYIILGSISPFHLQDILFFHHWQNFNMGRNTFELVTGHFHRFWGEFVCVFGGQVDPDGKREAAAWTCPSSNLASIQLFGLNPASPNTLLPSSGNGWSDTKKLN